MTAVYQWQGQRQRLASATVDQGLSVECCVSYATAVQAQVGRELVQVIDRWPEPRQHTSAQYPQFFTSGQRRIDMSCTALPYK